MISTNYGKIAFTADYTGEKPPQREPVKATADNAKKAVASTEITDSFVKDAIEPKSKKQGLKIGSIVTDTVNKWENFLKFKARVSEYTKGAVSGTIAGLGVGGAVMSFDWAMNGVSRIAHKKAKPSIYITEPAKLVGKAFSKVFKGIYNIPEMKVKDIFKKTLHSPIDLFEYVKNAKNVTKIGKVFAPLAGGAALAFCLTKAVMRANRRVADIEHAFTSGHAHDLK